MNPADEPYRPDRTPLVPPGQMDCHVRDMTATFSAEVTLAAAQEKLAEFNQWIPIDGDPESPLGHLVETNSTGPLRLGYGAWRDLLLGCQFTNGRDELITAGGRTVKNVAGYDLTKFMVGQGGVFGRLVTITTRTYKLPAAALLATFPPELALVGKLIPSPCRPQWMLLKPDALYCGYLGDQPTLDYHRATLGELGQTALESRSLQADAEFRQQLLRGQDPTIASPTIASAGHPAQVRVRVALPPARILEFVALAKIESWVADAAFGVLWADAANRAAARHIRNSAGVFNYSIGLAEGTEDATEPLQRALLKRLKDAFDPERKLAPLPWENSP